jgi:sec-independent protein translocase protein TatA
MPFAWWELVLILLVLLLVFGAKRLPEMGRSLGKGMREFKDSVTGMDEKPSSSAPPELESAETDTNTAPAQKQERETVT